MLKKLYSTLLLMLIVVSAAHAQITTSGINGKVLADGEVIPGATVTAKHVPSCTVYHAVSNANGFFALDNLRAGGPYEVEISYLGYQNKRFTNLQLTLGQAAELSVELHEDARMLKEIEIVSTGRSNMRTDRAGAVMSVNSDEIEFIPTVSRSLNDVMRLTPTGLNTVNGFSVGGGNYRQNFITVDGASFNNLFGIGQNLPANGTPISLDAIEQLTVSTSPFDVRQNGFTGAAVNAVTKSGTNEYKGSAYIHTTNVHLRGNKVGDVELMRTANHATTYGMTLGGPVIKDKVFLFVNGEYDDIVSAGPTAVARQSADGPWGAKTGVVHRPTVAQMNEISSYLVSKYGYNPGAYEGYSYDSPAYRLIARLDWNINDANRVNVRFSHTQQKESKPLSTSVSPLTDTGVYPGGPDGTAGRSGSGRGAYAALTFKNSNYSQAYYFTSVAGEWTARLTNSLGNMLRITYTNQDEPREYDGGDFPLVDILENGSVLASFGTDLFSKGNVRQVKSFVATDELTYAAGLHKMLLGLQFESNVATNGYQQAGTGYYVYSSWDDFKNDAPPAAYAVTLPRQGTSPFEAELKFRQFSLYLQDQMNLHERFRMNAGLRFELPHYPALHDNYNVPYARLVFNQQAFRTDQVPETMLAVSPRLGFNWDVLGEQKMVVRGGTGYFVGRLPYVWLVSTVLNSNCGQIQYSFNNPSQASAGIPAFRTTVAQQVEQLNIDRSVQTAPQYPTILDTKLRMNAAWKTSLALDVKLPYDIDLTIEGLYSRDYNPAVITNVNAVESGNTLVLSPYDQRTLYTGDNAGNQAYYITNGDNKPYYYAVTAILSKKFDFGLNLSAAYTFARARSFGDGMGDQVTSAYSVNRYSVGAVNGQETGYSTFVSPHRLIVSAAYRKEYLRNFATTVGLVYEGRNMGLANGVAMTRYSYTFSTNLIGDGGPANLIRIPATREELDNWEFAEQVYNKANKANEPYTVDGNLYTAQQQRDDFWAYIQQDSYLKNHKGQYATRGGAIMPWHHQMDFKLIQDFFIHTGKYKNTLQMGVDIENLPNLLNKKWGLYKMVNNPALLAYNSKAGAAHGYTFQKNGKERLTGTYSDYADFASTYRVMFTVRYIFN